MSHRCLSRRKLIASALAGGSAFALRNAIFPSFARADFDPDTGPLLVFCYFKGGWDQLLCTDPRNNDGVLHLVWDAPEEDADGHPRGSVLPDAFRGRGTRGRQSAVRRGTNAMVVPTCCRT